MISVYNLKSKFQNLLRPVCQWLADSGVTANQVTISAIILSVIYGGLLCLNIQILWLFLPLILFVRMALNAIDGMLARDHNMKSKLGMALNELGDIISDVALFIPFIFFAPQDTIIISMFIGVAILTETCGLLAFMISGERRYDGPMGKSDRAFVTGFLGFLIGLGVNIIPYLFWMFLGLFMLCLLACYKRINAAIL